jgi:O-antigen ligase
MSLRSFDMSARALSARLQRSLGGRRSRFRALVRSGRTLSEQLKRAELIHAALQRLREMELSAIFWLTAATLLSSLMLGGGTRGGFLSDALLQLLSIPALVVGVASLSGLLSRDRLKLKQANLALIFCLGLVAVPLLQLVPLPPWLWRLLPNRAPMLAVFDALGRNPGWLPVSVSANATWLSAVALLPPLAVFTGTMLLRYRERRLLSLLVVSFGIISAFLGLLQLAQGPSSPLRFFSFTNTTEAVGFFANRNHFAALLYATLLFAGVWAADVGLSTGIWRDRRMLEGGRIVALTAGFLAIVVLLAAEAMARSRTGMALTMVAIVGIGALIFRDSRRQSDLKTAGLVLGAGGVAALFVVQFGLYRILATFAADPVDDARFQFLRNTLTAAKDYMPFGSGMGTFVPVYAMYEKPAEAFAQYVNHAHNDIAELMLESGVPGMALQFAFVAWFVVRSKAIWRRAEIGSGEFDRLLARAATIVIGLLMLHSLVDYPLRTAAMSGVFALACALMLAPLRDEPRKMEAQQQRPSRRTLAARAAATVPELSSATPASEAASRSSAAPVGAPRRIAARWGEGIDWPDAWRKPVAGEDTKRAGSTMPQEADKN